MLINCVYSSHNIVLCVASVCKWVHTVVENHCSSQHQCSEAYTIITLVRSMTVTHLSRTMNRLKVAYNDWHRMVLGIPRYCSASEMFAYTNVPSCQRGIRLNMYSFMKRIQCMKNELVHSIVHSDLIFSYLLWLNWRQRLFYVPSEMFAYTNVPSCQCGIRLNMYSFMKRIQCMKNELVHSIVHSDLIFSYLLWLNWRQRLFYVPNS